MTDSDYIIGIDEVNDVKAFFKSLLFFYASLDVILTTYGKFPHEVHTSLSDFKAHTSWVRRLFFNQVDWHLNSDSVNSITESLCADSVIEKFTWGITKNGTPLGLCRAWDDMNVYGSGLIEDTALFLWFEGLKSNEILDSYEKIID